MSAPVSDRRQAHGVAYGLCFEGLSGAGLLPPGSERYPKVFIRQQPGTPPGGAARTLESDRARIPLLDGSHVVTISRQQASAVYHGPKIAPDELVHPHLVAPAVVHSRWRGREAFHAGGVVLDGGAWVIIGQAQAGKSTLLAALAARGAEVLADDLVVVEGLYAFAGPRSIDLRSALPAALGGAPALSRSRRESRLRMALGPIAPRVPLRGWLFLGWGEAELAPIGPAECLARLAAWRSAPELDSDPGHLLALAGLPAFTLCRQRGWDALQRRVQTLAERLTGAPALG